MCMENVPSLSSPEMFPKSVVSSGHIPCAFFSLEVPGRSGPILGQVIVMEVAPKSVIAVMSCKGTVWCR